MGHVGGGASGGRASFLDVAQCLRCSPSRQRTFLDAAVSQLPFSRKAEAARRRQLHGRRGGEGRGEMMRGVGPSSHVVYPSWQNMVQAPTICNRLRAPLCPNTHQGVGLVKPQARQSRLPRWPPLRCFCRSNFTFGRCVPQKGPVLRSALVVRVRWCDRWHPIFAALNSHTRFIGVVYPVPCPRYAWHRGL